MFVKLAFENEEITLRARARTREMKRYIVSLPSEVEERDISRSCRDNNFLRQYL